MANTDSYCLRRGSLPIVLPMQGHRFFVEIETADGEHYMVPVIGAVLDSGIDYLFLHADYRGKQIETQGRFGILMNPRRSDLWYYGGLCGAVYGSKHIKAGTDVMTPPVRAFYNLENKMVDVDQHSWVLGFKRLTLS